MKSSIILLIAMACHSINRAYCLSMDDDSQPTWEDAPDWQKKSAIAGVEMHLANPDATPEQSHESWLKEKLEGGWKYGPEKDAKAKTHPCIMPYEDLPPEQRAKDYLFKQCVKSAVELIAGVSKGEGNAKSAEAIEGVTVVYIGRRDEFVDNLYGSGLRFAKGSPRTLPPELANKLLRHADCFERSDSAVEDDDTTQALQAVKKEQDKKDEEREQLQDLYDVVNAMRSKKALSDYAKTKYRIEIEQGTVAEMKTAVLGLIDQYGAVG